jgi:hypothetical protein
MKQSLLLLLSGALLLGSCKKDPVNTEDQVGGSRVTRFPTFTLNGSQYQSIVVGSTYTDPGATAKEGETPLTVTTSGTVDATAVGVYNVTYSAINKDGFPGTITRTVAVLPEAETAGVDISGRYQNVGSFSYTATLVKLAPGFYSSDNVWGGTSAAIIPAYIFSTDGSTILLPLSELSGYGRVEGTGTLDAAGNLNLRVSLLDQGVSNSLRKWKKL